MDIKRDFTYTQCKTMINMLENIENIKQTTVSEISEAINVSVNNPQFWMILRYLKSINAIIFKQKIGTANIISINRKLLRDFIDEQEVTEFWYTYFNHNHLCQW